MQKEECEMTHDEKIELVASITESLVSEAERLKQLYGAVVNNKYTTAEITDKLEETSHHIAEIQNKIETITKIKA